MLFVNRFPKTRTGKVMRKIMRKIIHDEKYKFPATIDDASALDHIAELSLETGFPASVVRPD